MKNALLKIDPERMLGPVSSALFGHFVEFMYDCIDPGLYAEMLTSRKFSHPAENHPGISSPWTPVGRAEYHLESTGIDTAANLQRIRVGGGFGGILQYNLLLHAHVSYTGTIRARADGLARMQVRVFDDAGTIFLKDFPADTAWEKHSFSFTPTMAHENASISIVLLQTGVLWIAQISLRPENRICGCWPKVMRKIEELAMGVLRFPGGCFADTYHWRDGVGQIDFRPARPNRHWGGMEENSFGTDEFIALCRHLKCAPLICVNFGDATSEEAADWVEYCNGDVSTKFGALRAQNGHPEPYAVKYWDIGNETFASWEVGHCSAAEYAEKYVEFAKAMRRRDPSITLIACGGDGNSTDQSWNETILPVICEYVDILALHTYAPMIADNEYPADALYDAVVAGAPQKFAQVLDLTMQTVCRHSKNREILLAVTEWNTSYHNDSLREQTLEAALSNAGLLNVFLRRSADLALCTASDLVNGWPGGLIRSARGEAFGTPSYYAMRMYATAQLRKSVFCEVDCALFDTPAVGNITSQQGVSLLDAAAGVNARGEIILFLVNRSRMDDISLKIDGVSYKTARGEILCAENYNLRNALYDEQIIPRAITFHGQIVLPPMSVCALTLQNA